jgi:hypothetical protein
MIDFMDPNAILIIGKKMIELLIKFQDDITFFNKNYWDNDILDHS